MENPHDFSNIAVIGNRRILCHRFATLSENRVKIECFIRKFSYVQTEELCIQKFGRKALFESSWNLANCISNTNIIQSPLERSESIVSN